MESPVRYDTAMNATASAALALIIFASAGCQQTLYDPDRATRAYPRELHRPVSINAQVFRDGEYIEIQNATAVTYRDVDVWINQRYMKHVDEIPAGGSVELYLGDFWDQYGEAPVAGGFWRTDPPTPVRLVELQLSEEEPMIGLVAIRAEDVRRIER